MAKHADYLLDPSRELIDYDLNIYCLGEFTRERPEWQIAFRDYADGASIDLDGLEFTLPEDFCRAIGLVDYVTTSLEGVFPNEKLELWMDGGLDTWIDLNSFLELYAEEITPRLARRLSKLPEYREVALDRHK
jgi:hypothetical protein